MKRSRCWERDVNVDGQTVTYRAHANADPETFKLLDILATAAYRQMREQHVIESSKQTAEQAETIMQSDEEMEAEYQAEVARLMARGYSEQWAKENASWELHVRHGGD